MPQHETSHRTVSCLLLIVRELLLGSHRYTHLRAALPGMWTNLLAERLRDLEAAGVVRRDEMPPPAAPTVYDLTQDGQRLESVVLALAVWGCLVSSRDPPTTTGPLPPPFWPVRGPGSGLISPATSMMVYEIRFGERDARRQRQESSGSRDRAPVLPCCAGSLRSPGSEEGGGVTVRARSACV